MFKNLEKSVIFLLIFFLPTQLGLHFWPNWSYVFGIRIDYLSPTLYLTDILILTLILIDFFKIKNGFIYLSVKKNLGVSIFMLFLIIINIGISSSIFLTTYKWLKFLEIYMLTLILTKSRFFTQKTFIHTSVIPTIFVSTVGILQFINGETLGGLLYFFGERTFNTSTPAIALVNFFGFERLRAYSFFSHPNSLGAYLSIFLLLFIFYFHTKKLYIKWLSLLIIGICILLTFSNTVFIGMFAVGCLTFLKKSPQLFNRIVGIFIYVVAIVSLLVPLFTIAVSKSHLMMNENISQRLDLGYISGKIISRHPILGVGLGNFIINSVNYRGIYSNSWLLQPVHNIFLLVFSELGLVGLLVFVYFLRKLAIYLIRKNNSYYLIILCFVLVTGLTDHYWISLQQNILLISLLIARSLRYD